MFSRDSMRTIVHRLRAGDVAALESAYRDAYTPLWDFAFRYVRDEAQAEDIVHDVFASLWERRTSLETDVSLDRYLFAAVRNRVLHHVRHAYVERRSANVVTEFVPGMGTPAALPDAALYRSERRHAITRALAQLSDAHRDILMLRWHRGLSYGEIAAILGISLDAAKQQGSRAQRALRVLLEESGID